MNCPTCGPVEHQPIKEDEAHCPCLGFYGSVTIKPGPDGPTITNHPCDCECHR